MTRPPYQRKNVWQRKKKQALLDSLFRRYYVPRIVVREVRLSDQKTLREVIDGQQRITTAQEFFSNRLELPISLEDVHPDLAGASYKDLSAELRRFIDQELRFEADIVKGIDNPKNPDHQEVATEIFWRLQQGESLNHMEVAHARLDSLARNFLVKYADDITFDFEQYRPVDQNPSKHPFFKMLRRKNGRMQHLALLCRFIMLEEAGKSTDIRENDIKEFIQSKRSPTGIGDESYANTKAAKNVLRTLKLFVQAFSFSDGKPRDHEDVVPELRIEYFIISMYLLLRHLSEYYVLEIAELELFRSFVINFHERWRQSKRSDADLLAFKSNRQQSAAAIAERQQILRLIFFSYTDEKGVALRTKDKKRSFSEADRIRLFRRDEGLCQKCLKEGKSKADSRVAWSEFEADHVLPHSKGGDSVAANGQILCRRHNRIKGSAF